MQNQTKKLLLVSSIVVIAALTRLIPHPMNFAPLGAMALFGSAYFGRKGMGLFLTMLAWFISDLVLNNFVYSGASGLFTQGAFFIYGSIVLIYLLGATILKKITVTRLIAGSLSASLLFFVISNFGVWIQGGLYPLSFEGLIACYTAAIPFVKNTIIGDLFYSGILFVVYERLFKAQLTQEDIRS